MLVDHADPKRHRFFGRGKVKLFSLIEDHAVIHPVHSVQAIHQGGFSGSVFSDQGVDFAFFNAEADVVVGEHRPESFGYIPEFQFIFLHRCLPCHKYFSAAAGGGPGAGNPRPADAVAKRLNGSRWCSFR